MCKRLYRSLRLLLAVVFIISGSMVALQVYDQYMTVQNQKGAEELVLASEKEEKQEIEELEEIETPLSPTPEVTTDPESIPEPAPLPEPAPDPELPEEAEVLLDYDIHALKETNEDVLGWLYIPDTNISYPLMESEDNQDYLRTAWNGTKNTAGSIFLECKNSRDFSDFNSLIYGHNMGNDTMFSELVAYGDEGFAKDHDSVYIVLPDRILEYQVFSAYTAAVTSDTYRLYFEDEERKQESIQYYLEQAMWEREMEPTGEDRILTLSTCTGAGLVDYNYRWVVQAVLVEEYSNKKEGAVS